MAVAILLVCGGVAPGAAVDLVSPDPWQVIHAVRALGPAEVGRDDFRDPQIIADLTGPDGAPSGLRYHVTFYGCDMGGRNCQSVLLTIRLSKPRWRDRPPYRAVAKWNRTKLIGRAWIDDRKRAVLDHALVMGPGLPPETLTATLAAWIFAMQEFAQRLDFKPK